MARTSISWSAAITCLLALSGCASAPQTLDIDEVGGPSLDPSADYVHERTGMVFPGKVGHFVRANVAYLDERLIGVEVAYTSENPMYAASILAYLYPGLALDNQGQPMWVNEASRQRLLRQRIKEGTNEFLTTNPTASFVSEETVFITQRLATVEAPSLTFHYAGEFNSRALPYGAKFYFIALGDWLLVYRIDFPREDIEDAKLEIRDFMRALVLPGYGGNIGSVAAATPASARPMLY